MRCRPNGSARNERAATAFLPSRAHRPTSSLKSHACSARGPGPRAPHVPMANQIEFGRARPTGLVEVLDRILDKGLFVGGDIKISLADVELLTIRIRLIVCS